MTLQPFAQILGLAATLPGGHAGVCCAPWELPEKVPTTLRGISLVNPETQEHCSLGFALFRTPPFSSEEELDAGDLIQAYTSPDLPLVQSSKNSRSGFARKMVKSDTDWTEGSEIEDSDISPKPTGELLPLRSLWETLCRAVVLNQAHHALAVWAGSVLRRRQGFCKAAAAQENGWCLATH